MLSRVLSLGKAKIDGRQGFVYVHDKDAGPMRRAVVGHTVWVEGGGPPWIVVDEEPSGVTVAKWPGRLWKVQVVEAARPNDQPYSYAKYIRANAVEIIAEEDVTKLFGTGGHDVIQVLDRARCFSRDEAVKASLNRHPQAPAAYDRVFRTWAKTRDIPIEWEVNLDGTLAMGSMRNGSPINGGLKVLHGIVFERAKTLDGDDATETDGEEVYLLERAAAENFVYRVNGDQAVLVGYHVNSDALLLN